MSRAMPRLHNVLSEEQQHVADWIDYSAGDRNLLKIGGAAGTGKSFLLEHVARRHPEAILAAPTNIIARKLARAVGRPAYTLHKLLYRPHEVIIDGGKRLEWRDNGHEIGGQLVLIDEASMVPGWIANDLLNRGADLLAFGDQHQLPPPNGEPFFVWPDYVLTQIHRQAANSGIIRQAHRILSGLPVESDREFQLVDRCGPHLAWADAIIVWRIETRRQVNFVMRSMYGIDRHALPQRGEPLICVATDHRNDIVNGEQFVVVNDQQEGRPLILQGATGIIEVAKPHIADITTGEPTRGETQLALGYCMTAHKAQGLEWPRVLIFDEGIRPPLQRSWLYTATTRASEQVKVARRL
jgi:exodeoxyribonuclease-5